MKITFFGTGYSIPTCKRHNTSLFVQSDETNLMIDCNGVTMQRLHELNVDLKDVMHIFLTHAHPDHISALPGLVHQIWVKECFYVPAEQKRTAPLNIYAGWHTIDCVKKSLDALNLMKLDGLFPIVFHELDDDGGSFFVEDIKVEAFPVVHNNIPCLGCRITEADKKLVYTADSEPCDTIYKGLNDGDILVHDCNSLTQKINPGHTTWPQIEKMLPDLPDIDVYLVHIPDIDEGLELQMAELFKTKYNGQITLTEDMHALEF